MKDKRKKTNKDRRKQGSTKAIVKSWELNDFVVRLSLVLSNQYDNLL